MVLLVIYKNARKGFSGIIFNRERHMEREILEKIPNALVLECKGLKIQKEGFFEQMKKKCRSLLRAFPKVEFFWGCFFVLFLIILLFGVEIYFQGDFFFCQGSYY
jgi:hypothetical protein